NELPEIYDALNIEIEKTEQTEARTLVLEVSLHLGDNSIRAIAMSGTDGVQRGMEVIGTGNTISVPVIDATLGHVFNVLGETIDEARDMAPDKELEPIHRESPSFEDLTTDTEILVTGIKVVDLLAPYIKGGKIGLFGGAGVGKTV